jgi:hypothetical protein
MKTAARLAAASTLVIALQGGGRTARAEETGVGATFALIIGSNVSVDRDLPPLKYADDDAASYQELFRLLGARTYLVSRLDEDTRRLHPQAAAEALEPTRASLERATAQLAVDISQARKRGVAAVLYILYAGHGNINDGQGYVTLEDMRITGADLARLIAPIPAVRVHIIVDACASYYLAYSRGPGGERRPLSGFQDASPLVDDPRVGLLLSTSSARESHEWAAIQAGVFSHEVRSGLYGGADADGDGLVSYREIAAFVNRANAAIPNERYRPNIFARPPRQTDTLLNIRNALARRLDIDGAHAGHYTIEDARGVRVLDVHNDDHQAVSVVRPSPNGTLYVRRTGDDAEMELAPGAPDVVAIGELEVGSRRVASRGAANDAFRLLFSLPFDRAVVDRYVALPPDEAISVAGGSPADVVRTPSPRWRRVLGWTFLGLGVAGLGTGAALSVSALVQRSGASSQTSQLDASHINARISSFETGADIAYIAGGALAAAGGALLLWPTPRPLRAGTGSVGLLLGYDGRF